MMRAAVQVVYRPSCVHVFQCRPMSESSTQLSRSKATEKRRMAVKDLKDPQNAQYATALQSLFARRYAGEPLTKACSNEPGVVADVYSKAVFQRIRDSPSAIACVCVDEDTDEVLGTMSMLEYARFSETWSGKKGSAVDRPAQFMEELDEMFWLNVSQRQASDPLCADLHTYLEDDAASTNFEKRKVMEIGRTVSVFPEVAVMCGAWLLKQAYKRGVRVIVGRFNDNMSLGVSSVVLPHMNVLASLEYRKSCIADVREGEVGTEPRFQSMNTKPSRKPSSIVKVNPDYCGGHHVALMDLHKIIASM